VICVTGGLTWSEQNYQVMKKKLTLGFLRSCQVNYQINPSRVIPQVLRCPGCGLLYTQLGYEDHALFCDPLAAKRHSNRAGRGVRFDKGNDPGGSGELEHDAIVL